MLETDNDSYIRLCAEFQNYKNRTNKEILDIIKTSSKKVIIEILDIVDDFERITDKTDGVNLIYKKLLKVLEVNSCKEMDVLYKDFDSDKMEAISQLNSDMKNKVIDVVQKGYVMNDIIIRYPKVIIGV